MGKHPWCRNKWLWWF